jgi:hypothetical protein
MKHILSLTAAALLAATMSTSAFAQTASPGAATSPGVGSGPGAATLQPGQEVAPGALDVETTGTLFADPGQMQLRADDELRTNFLALSPEEQAAVRAECERIDGGAAAQTEGWTQLCERVQGF